MIERKNKIKDSKQLVITKSIVFVMVSQFRVVFMVVDYGVYITKNTKIFFHSSRRCGTKIGTK